MKNILVVLLIAFALPAGAKVTCKENVMTPHRYCSSEFKMSGENSFFFATDDTGAEALVLFSFGGLISSARPDAVMVKLDSGAPFKVSASATRPDVNCRRYSSCRWTVGAAAKFTDDQFAQITNSSKMLVSFTEGSYVSDPIEVDPKKIGEWFQQWKAITNTATNVDSSSELTPKK